MPRAACSPSIFPASWATWSVTGFRNETEANKMHKTYLAYKKSSEYFLQFCSKPTV